MNQTLTSVKPEIGSRRFIVEMHGFSNAEKAMLASTFRLTGRRDFCYREASAPEQRADIYLANADNPGGMAALQACSPNAYAPAVLVGRTCPAAGWPMISKPIQWTRLFDQLDLQMQAALAERARRPAGRDPHWDGRSFRRASDCKREPQPVSARSKPVETVLVVDDSATVRAFMRARLAPFRFDMDFAESGEAALDMVQARRYNCIFLDILMPGIDGYQVCKRIKSSQATMQSAVVMLSSKSSAFDKFRGNWAGCDAYLGKPVSEGELLATIARFLPSARRAANEALFGAL